MANSQLNVTYRTKRTGSGTQEVKGELDNLKGSFTELKSQLDLAKGAFDAVSGTVSSIITPAIEYGQKVRELSAFTGASAEDSSELIQVLDDLGVEYGTLKMAAKALTENGLQPNLKTLAELSEEYNAIQDPVEQAQYLVDKFGARAGPELAFALGQGEDALLAMGDAARTTGLVVGEEFLDRAREAELALDDWEDSVLSLKIALSETLLPVVTAVTNQAATQVSVIGNVVRAFREGELGLGEYVAMSWDVVYGSKTMADANAELVERLYGTDQAAEDATAATQGLADTYTTAAIPATYDYEAAERAAQVAAQEQASAEDAKQRELSETQAATDLVRGAIRDYNTEMLFNAASVGLNADQQLALAGALGLLDSASLTVLGTLPKLREEVDLDKDGIIDAGRETQLWLRVLRDLNAQALAMDGQQTHSTHTHDNVVHNYTYYEEPVQRNYTYGYELPADPNQPAERAAGGDYQPGPIRVGEEGMELLWPSIPGYVMNNANSNAMLRTLSSIDYGIQMLLRRGGSTFNVYTSQAEVDLYSLRSVAAAY